MFQRIILFGGGLCPEQLLQPTTASKPSQQIATAKGQIVTIPPLLQPLQTQPELAPQAVQSNDQTSLS